MALSIPMITSTKMSEADILLNLGVEGRAQRARERTAVNAFGHAAEDLLQMRIEGIRQENPDLKLTDKEIRDKAIKELTTSLGGAAAELRSNLRFRIREGRRWRTNTRHCQGGRIGRAYCQSFKRGVQWTFRSKR